MSYNSIKLFREATLFKGKGREGGAQNFRRFSKGMQKLLDTLQKGGEKF